jgi:signal transduction histidine kinase
VAIPLRDDVVVVVLLGVVYLYVVVTVARRLGSLYAFPFAIAAALAFDSFYIPPTRRFGSGDLQNYVEVAIYLGLGVVAGVFAARAQERAGSSERVRAMLADEQAALRRVAVLVAEGGPEQRLFDVVSEEVGRLLHSDLAALIRFEPDEMLGTLTVWSAERGHLDVGGHRPLGAGDLAKIIFNTQSPARVDDWTGRPGPLAEFVRGQHGVRSSVGCPIVVAGQLWGALIVHSTRSTQLPPGTESRLANFTELVATAVASAHSRAEVTRLAAEQAALRRVATMVAHDCPADQVFAAIAEALGEVLHFEDVRMIHFDDEETATIVGSWGTFADAMPVGHHQPITGYAGANGAPGHFHAAIEVDGQLWGTMVASTSRPDTLPPETESRIGEFTELLATAISNLQVKSEVAASRTRIVAAADEERRRVVRDLHDGAQQRLVHTIVTLKMAGRALRDERNPEHGLALVDEGLDHAEKALVELRELAHGILPSVLTWGGLPAGVADLASRIPVPVDIDVAPDRFSPAVEASAYFVIAEALTNVAKHAHAAHATVRARVDNGALEVEIADDGVGSADFNGHGLMGLADRVASLDGALRVMSTPGRGTTVRAVVPLRN